MADTHVISALVKKRAELRGDIIHYKQLIATLDKDLQTIDATIKIFDVDYDISSIKPVIKSRNRFFNNGEVKVLVFIAPTISSPFSALCLRLITTLLFGLCTFLLSALKSILFFGLT